MKKIFSRKNNSEKNLTKWDNFGMNFFLAVMGAGVLLAAWMLMQQGARNQVVHEFNEAARSGNIQSLETKTDWASVRQWMKNDIKERALLQHAVFVAPERLDEIVDSYVRPENLVDIVHSLNGGHKDMDPLAFVSNARFSGITEFTIEIMVPPSKNEPYSKPEAIRAGFALDDLKWKLKKLDAPRQIVASAVSTQ